MCVFCVESGEAVEKKEIKDRWVGLQRQVEILITSRKT